MTQQWGVGNRKNDKAFQTVKVGEQEVELIFGEHPHSRSDNNIYARFPSGEVESFSGHRILHRIEFNDYNYRKDGGVSDGEVRQGGQCKIYINDYLVYEFFYRDVQRAMIQATTKLDQIHEHSIQVWRKEDRDKLIGRKVYYREFPAKIERYVSSRACVVMVPDHHEGLPFPVPCFEKDEDYREDENEVLEDIYSPHIWWYRD